MVIKYFQSMEKIKQIPLNGLKVVSTFSGAGGSCLGYRMAGFNVVWANEFIKSAYETYRINMPQTDICTSNVRTINPKDIVTKFGNIDLLDGSPPCSAFSTSGSRQKGWNKVKEYSDTKQRVDDLFFEYARFLKELQPKAFIAENVSGLIKGVAKGYYNTILSSLVECGYNVRSFLLDASAFGIPQSRKRLFFVGFRRDLNLRPTPPPQNKFKSRIKDWKQLSDIKSFMAGGRRDNWCYCNRPYPTVTARIGGLSKTAYLSANGYVKDSKGNIRKLTIEEAKVICSFPQDFKLIGSFEQQFERLGRSVPPILMANISNHVARILKNGNT